VSNRIHLGSNLLTRLVIFAVFTLALLLIQAAIAPRAHATTYNPSPSPAPGECDLYNAFSAISTQSASGGCDAGTPNNTINLSAGTYTLASNLPSISVDGDLTINGASATSTIIDGGANSGILFGPSSGAYSLSISNLSITNFNTSSGDAVIEGYNGNITLNHLLIHDNRYSGMCFLFEHCRRHNSPNSKYIE
jgi:hypothetical protein